MLIEINCYSSDQSVLRCQNIRVLCGVGWFITKTNILTANFNYFVRTRRDGDHFELMYQELITYFRKVMYKNMSMTYFTNKWYFVQSVFTISSTFPEWGLLFRTGFPWKLLLYYSWMIIILYVFLCWLLLFMKKMQQLTKISICILLRVFKVL